MSIHEQLIRKFNDKSSLIAIIGLGYVGLPYVAFCRSGLSSYRIDIDTHKVDLLNKNESYIQHIPSQRLKELSSLFEASTDFSKIVEADAIIYAFPPP